MEEHIQTRKLATIEEIIDIQPIEGADAIEVATVKGWKVVVAKKDSFKIGDPCIYIEIDSILDPENPDFTFMQLRHFRVKTIKLRGQISQGLVFPVTILPVNIEKEFHNPYKKGDDVTEVLKITKYEPNIPANLAGLMKGNFPIFLRKTDEERIQNLSSMYDVLKKHTYWETEKLDGSSFTCYLKDGEFGVCSRNIDLIETPDNSFWKAARALEIEEKMIKKWGKGNYCLQGELIGNGVQGNKYSFAAHTIRFYNIFDIDNQVYFDMQDFIENIREMGLNTVPILNEGEMTLPSSIEELVVHADGKSVLNVNAWREGLVLRNNDRTISFKIISNKFLLKNEE